MRRFLSILLVVFCSLNVIAQKRLKSFSAPISYMDVPVNLYGSLDYNDEGNPSKLSVGMRINYMGSEQNFPFLSDAYSYQIKNFINQTVDLSQLGEGNLSTVASLLDGHVVSLTYTKESIAYSYDIYYDENNHLSSIAGTNETGQDVNCDLVWNADGNLANLSTIINGDSSSTVTFEYIDVKADPALNSIISMVVENTITDNAFITLTPVKYFGLTCSNLPSKVYSVSYTKDDDTSEFSIEKDTLSFDYTIGDDGYVSKVTAKGVDMELDDDDTVDNLDFNLTWEDIPVTGISSVKSSLPLKGTDEYFSLDGTRITSPRKGVNIVHHADGSVQKFFLK